MSSPRRILARKARPADSPATQHTRLNRRLKKKLPRRCSSIGVHVLRDEAADSGVRSRVKRVASNLFYNLTLTFSCIEAKEVLYGGKVEGLHIFRENSLLYSSFVGDRKFFLESILFYTI